MTTNYVPRGGHPNGWPRQTAAWPLIGILDPEKNSIKLCPLDLDGIQPPQKNWIPFGKDGETFLQYSIAPHRILRVNPHTGRCQDAWLTSTNHQTITGKNDFKGGAPLISVGGQLLGACHSWSLNKDNEREYLTYLYSTEADPPYAITQMSPPLKILLPHRVQYMVGVALSMSKNCLVLSFGVNDCDNYFVEISLKEVFGLFEQPTVIEQT